MLCRTWWEVDEHLLEYDADLSCVVIVCSKCDNVQTIPVMFPLKTGNSRLYFILSMREFTYLIIDSSFIMRRSSCEIVAIALLFVHTENGHGCSAFQNSILLESVSGGHVNMLGTPDRPKHAKVGC